MSVEFDILLLCSRIKLNNLEQDRLQVLSRGNVKWPEVLNLALFHRTLPLVYRQLKSHCTDLLPDSFVTDAKDSLRRLGAQNLMMSATLMRVLASLEAKGIQAVPFKGPVFAQSVFGDLALRNYGDLDILVAEEDFPGAVESIKEEGFIPCFPLVNSQLKALAKTDNEYPLQQPANGIVIDLQWELLGGYSPQPLYLSALLPNLRNIDFLGKSVTVFGHEDLLVYLCVHGNQHVWEQLDQVCCVAELIRTCPDLDWVLIWRRAEELRVGRMIRIGLSLTVNLLGVELPADVMLKIKTDSHAIALAEERGGNIAQPLSMKERSLASRRFVLYHLKSLDSCWQVFRYSCHLLFLPTRYDWQLLPLPVWLRYLHFLYRPLRLIWAGINAFLRKGK